MRPAPTLVIESQVHGPVAVGLTFEALRAYPELPGFLYAELAVLRGHARPVFQVVVRVKRIFPGARVIEVKRFRRRRRTPLTGGIAVDATTARSD